MSSDPLSLRMYLRAWGEDWLASMSGPLSVPFGLLSAYVPGLPEKITLGLLAISCVLFASYRVWMRERSQAVVLQDQVASLSDPTMVQRATRKFEVAEQALHAFQICKLVIDEARQASGFGHEGAALMVEAGIPTDEQDRLREYFAVLERLRSRREDLNRLLDLQQVVKIHFGDEAHDLIGVIWKYRRKVEIGASTLIRYRRNTFDFDRNREHIQKMEARIYADFETPDPIKVALNNAEQRLLTIFGPSLGRHADQPVSK